MGLVKLLLLTLIVSLTLGKYGNSHSHYNNRYEKYDYNNDHYVRHYDHNNDNCYKDYPDDRPNQNKGRGYREAQTTEFSYEYDDEAYDEFGWEPAYI